MRRIIVFCLKTSSNFSEVDLLPLVPWINSTGLSEVGLLPLIPWVDSAGLSEVGLPTLLPWIDSDKSRKLSTCRARFEAERVIGVRGVTFSALGGVTGKEADIANMADSDMAAVMVGGAEAVAAGAADDTDASCIFSGSGSIDFCGDTASKS